MNRRARSLTLNAIVIAVVLGLLVAANILVSKTPQAWDLTRAGNNTLAPQSVLAAKGLTSDLQVIGLFRPSTNSGQNETEALVALYAAQSSHLRYRSANADQDASPPLDLPLRRPASDARIRPDEINGAPDPSGLVVGLTAEMGG